MQTSQVEHGSQDHHYPWLSEEDGETWRKRKMYRFLVECDNSKRHRTTTGYQKLTAEGILFSSGHIVLDTPFIKPDYRSYQEMTKTLLTWGKFQMRWIDIPPQEMEWQ